MTSDEPAGAKAARSLNLLRELSDQAVLETIFRDGPITRPEIAAGTGLSKPTVSDAVRRLVQERLVRAAGIRAGGHGRSPVSYVVDDSAAYVIGVDVGGTYIRIAAADLYGELLTKREVSHRGASGTALAQQVGSVVREIDRSAGATHSQLLAVGASTAGVPASGEDPLGIVRTQVSVPVFTDTNINLSAVGEKWRGHGQDVSDFAFLSIGATVGVGIVVADELVRGVHGLAGEIRFAPSASAGGQPAILAEAMSAPAVVAGASSLSWTATPPLSIEDVFRTITTEASSQTVLAAEARRIADAIIMICGVLDPALVVLGGGIGSYPQLLGPVCELTCGFIPDATRIETTSLPNEAALYGALAVALRAAREQLFKRGTRGVLEAGRLT